MSRTITQTVEKVTTSFTCKWAGSDAACEQKKLEARKLSAKRSESHSSSARCVGQSLCPPAILRIVVCIHSGTYSMKYMFPSGARRENQPNPSAAQLIRLGSHDEVVLYKLPVWENIKN